MTAPLRVLSVEDSETDAKLLLVALRGLARPIQLLRVDTPESMRAALEKETWDLCVSDWSMPKFSGRAALSLLHDTKLDLPFILVSGTIGEETAVEAMRAGAHDFVLKEKLHLLVPAVERALREHAERAARRAAESALRESEGRFRRLTESGIIGIVVGDLDGGITEANAAFLSMIGYSPEERRDGKVVWKELIPVDFRQIADVAIAQLRTSGVAPGWEMELVRKDGTRVPVMVGAAMLAFPGTIAVFADLTARKQAEAGRARAELALRQSEDQLRHAQKMEAVGRLAGGMAHDFNNILSVIIGYGDIVLGELAAADPVRSDVSEICKAAARASDLTNQLLMLSRQQVVAPIVMDLHAALTSMEQMLQRLVGNDVELTIVTPKAPGRVDVDPGNIEQVILNLIINARDAMPTGGKLTVETQNVDLDEAYASSHLPAQAGPHVVLSVSDTGTGMSRETQAHIFEPFFTTKDAGKGTGLGLSTVFGIVRQSGGNVWVYSEPGKGTTFKVYLPRVEAQVEVRPPQPSPTTLQGTETVLLVENEEQVRQVVTAILRRQGYSVLVTEGGAAALVACQAHTGVIDLLLTDVVMPDMSGPELSTRVAAVRPGIKILFMSGYTDDSIVRHGVLDAGVAFIQKPLTPVALTTKVRAVLDT